MRSIAEKAPLYTLLNKTHFNPSYKWTIWLRHPLILCLLVGIVTRAYLIIHTHGIIAGDESMTGIQAEHILRGEHPIYYYSQPYMGSLEAYIIALVFLVVGPSVYALRTAMLGVSLLLIILTWCFAGALADEAKAPPQVKKHFMFIAAFVAALPPLYDAVLEMRSLGGYIEAMVIMLWLLLSALRLTRCWRDGSSKKELALRWTGIGFLVGLGFWTDPLVAYAVAASALWIAWFILIELIKTRRLSIERSRLTFLQETCLIVAAIPGAAVGFAPALYWGAHNQWQNILYILHNGSSVQQHRLQTIYQVQQLYVTCLAPRVIGGSLSTQPGVSQTHPHLLTAGLIINGCCILLATAGIVLSFFWKNTLITQVRKLTIFPLLFFICTSIIYCISSIATASLYAGCGPWDLTIRYVAPLVIALPFFLAAIVSLIWDIPQYRKQQVSDPNVSELQPVNYSSQRSNILLSILLLTILFVYFFTQGYAYLQSSPNNTYKTSSCEIAPNDDTPLITYMEQQQIRYALATGWISDPITLKTNGSLIVTEPYGRNKSNDFVVTHSDRYSFIYLIKHSKTQFSFLQLLDAKHITYHLKRFYSAPGEDLLLLTPLNRTIPLSDATFAPVFQALTSDC